MKGLMLMTTPSSSYRLKKGSFTFQLVPFYSGGRDETLSALQQRLGSPISLGLQGSTEWRSRVAWPK
jgi:hypothetical protein